MDSSVMPGQRARLSEPVAAKGAYKRLQVNMALVMHDEARALREGFLACNAVCVNEGALEHRRDGGIRAPASRYRNLLIGVHR